MVLNTFRWLLVVLVLILSACQPIPIRPSAPTTEAGSGTAPVAPAKDRSRTEPQPEAPVSARGAVDALQRQSSESLARGDWQAAINAAEHGLRVDRRYAPFYRLLGASYLKKGDLEAARAFARQALRYCGQNCAAEQALMRQLSQ